jgi:hypothetical protein
LIFIVDISYTQPAQTSTAFFNFFRGTCYSNRFDNLQSIAFSKSPTDTNPNRDRSGQLNFSVAVVNSIVHPL